MNTIMIKPMAHSAVVAHNDWKKAVRELLARVDHVSADLAILFANGNFAQHFPEIVRIIYQETNTRMLIGCSGQGVIGTGLELEDIPALSLLMLGLPGSCVRAVYLPPLMLEECESADDWRAFTQLACADVNAWLLFADPFHMDCDHFIAALARAYPGVPMIGGLASGDFSEQYTYIFLNDRVYDEGAVGLAIGGDYTLLPLVSQGCEPIGEAWTITSVKDNGLIATISNRPAYDLLVETYESLPTEWQRRVQHNLFVGLAANEYCESFGRGSFLVRNILGIERTSGAMAIAAFPRVGQTLQFQMRDAITADLDLGDLLQQTHSRLSTRQALAGVLCTCNGRGMGMFGSPHHDAGMVARELGAMPLSGLFCNGEIGPVGKCPFVHGFTASLGLIMPR